MEKRSKCLLVSFIAGALYALYLAVFFFGAISKSSSSAEAAGAGIAAMLVMPHMILIMTAVICNALGYWKNKRGFALAGAVFYSVGAAVFILYAPFCIVEIIFSFLGYGMLRRVHASSMHVI